MFQRMFHFFQARPGYDAYTFFLVLVFFLLRGVTQFTHFFPLLIPAYLALIYALFRFFSRNAEKRQMENARFMALIRTIFHWFRFQKTVRADKDHRYFKCPNCGQPLRVPRGKGRIQVFCSSCGVHFEEKS